MSRRCRPTSAAEQDVAEIAEYLAERDSQVAVRFLDAAAETFERLLSSPDLGSIVQFPEEPAETRVWHVDGFPKYLIYYQLTDDGIVVIRVVHGSRDIKRILGARDTD